MADLPSMSPLPLQRPLANTKERKRFGVHRLLLASIILIQIIGFAFLWMKIPEAPSAGTAIIDPASTIAAMKPPDEQLIREAIRNILKDELQTYVEQLQQQKLQTRQEKPRVARSGGSETIAPRTTPPSTNPQVAQEAMAIVDRALALGIWTDTDNNALLKLAPQLSEVQRVELLEKLFGAINRQQLKAAGSLPSL